ncbi:MAG: hypothetical protein ACREFI_10695 [Stellaceae bacterium]
MYGLDVSDHEIELANSVDPQTRRGADFYRVFVQIARGDWIAASQTAERVARDRPQLAMLPLATISAILADDIERARAIDVLADEMPITGRLGAANRLADQSLLLALDGRVGEAMPGLREALRVTDEMSAQLHYGMLALAMLKVLGPHSAAARAAGEHALETFERNKNHAMAEHVRAALTAAPGRTESGAAETAVMEESRA